MKSIRIFILSAIICSCSGHSNNTKETNTKTDSNVRTNEKLDLIITEPKSNNTEIPSYWKSLSSIQKEWIEVEKDKDGYLIYEPCDGNTPTIKFERGKLVIKPQIEPEEICEYDKFTRLTGDKSFRMDTKFGEIKATIFDYKKGLVLWEINGDKQLMTPIENSKNFRHIKNNCPDEKRNELKFDSIEKTTNP